MLLISLPSLLRAQPLAGTELLSMEGDLAARMVAGIDQFLLREIAAAPGRREAFWKRDFSSPAAYRDSVAPNLERFRRVIGLVEGRVLFDGLALDSTTTRPSLVASTETYEVHAVRWPVLRGVHGEGLLLQPKSEPRCSVIAIPDADWPPEMIVGLVPGVSPEAQFARRLVEQGCLVLVPVLIDRQDDWSRNPAIRDTNQPHREFVYRMAYQMGRHIIGYEVQKILAAVDWFARENPDRPVGVTGYGEGGLLAFYSAAIDERIDATLVSGYFGPRERVWDEPIYRNVWTLLREFGDAELAGLVAPRALVIEASRSPGVEGPPPASPKKKGAAPGRLRTPPPAEVKAEVERVRPIFDKLNSSDRLQFVSSGDGHGEPGSDAALSAFLKALVGSGALQESAPAPEHLRKNFNPRARLRLQFDELVDFTQALVRQSEFTRREFWKKADASSVSKWQESIDWYREYFWNEVIGRLPDPSAPLKVQTRKSYDEPKWSGYEVVLPVWLDVFAYGILLVPKDLKPGEKRPVVISQHGLDGRPQMIVDRTIEGPYHHYGARLADRGFVVFAPQNPYIGQERFRPLQRKANPVKTSIFSFIIGQHQRILDWLATLPYVDSERIGFYGLSYGGKTAVRVPPLLKQYALSICSADFNEWIWKNTSTLHRYTYMYTNEYEMVEFNLGNTFNYSELANMMAPRPFMVERGHDDGVAPDEWVAYEYAKVRRHYDKLGLGDKTEIEFFDGPHEIHGVGTFDFLHRHLNWPKQSAK